MRRTTIGRSLHRALRIARLCESRNLSTSDGIALAREAEHEEGRAGQTRREWLNAVGRVGIAGAVASVAAPIERLHASSSFGAAPDVGIVGAGLAGLACADALADRGIVATVYEAAERTGGRCWSLRGFFPGQVAERGGEFIDTPHKTMIRYAKRFGVALEDVTKKAGETVYVFGGRHIPEADVVDEFRAFVPVVHADLRRISNEVTALSHTPEDVLVDRTSLAEYLDGQNASGVAAAPIAKAAISAAYLAEYGLETDEQSCLNFLQFIHADRRSKFTPFGVSSDERYHVADGNDRIVQGLTAALPRPVELEMRLVAARRRAGGTIELTFDGPSGAVTRVHEVVVFALPFSVLRLVTLDASLNLPPAQRAAIDLLGYGMNAKLLVGFDGRPWIGHGSSGTAYSDLLHHQLTWETNRVRASATRGVLTDYASGDRGRTMSPAAVQAEAEAFLVDLDVVFPGAAAAASRRGNGSVVAHLEHWPSNPLMLGSYTCYRPGQFTSVAGLEGIAAGNIFFAGEHANSFYVWQGFMEGAALSGLDVAAAILRTAKK
jgi:monoamine oxidase